MQQRRRSRLGRCPGNSDRLIDRRDDADRLLTAEANAAQCGRDLDEEVDGAAQVGARRACRFGQPREYGGEIPGVLRHQLEPAGHLGIGVGELDQLADAEPDPGELQRVAAGVLQPLELRLDAGRSGLDLVERTQRPGRRAVDDQLQGEIIRHASISGRQFARQGEYRPRVIPHRRVAVGGQR